MSGAAGVFTAAVSMMSEQSRYSSARRSSRKNARLARSTERAQMAMEAESAAQQREDFAPWRDVGHAALMQIRDGISNGAFEVGDIDLSKDPGYQFRMEQGQKALDASASARGNLLSGAQQKALTRYGQGFGAQEYQAAHDREANKLARRYNILSAQSGLGQASAAGQAGATSQLGVRSSNIMGNSANAQARSNNAIGAASGRRSAGLSQAFNQGVQNWVTWQNSQDQPYVPSPVDMSDEINDSDFGGGSSSGFGSGGDNYDQSFDAAL